MHSLQKFIQNYSKDYLPLHYLVKFISYLYLVIYNIFNGSVTLVAGSLTYNTILAIVPIILVFFSVFSVLPHFNDLRNTIQELLFSILAPNSQDTLTQVFDNVVAHTNNLGLPAVLSLFVIAFLLIQRIDQTINQNIWKIKKRRNFISSFTTYWTVISFGPMLLGALMFAKGYLLSIYSIDDSFVSSTVIFILNYLQLFILWFILFFTYTFFPMKSVSWKSGIISSTLTTLTLLVCKNIFVYYITTFPSYYVIYGAIAAFPITVFWLYIVWTVILSGAQITRIIDESSFFLLLNSYMHGNVEDLTEVNVKLRDIYVTDRDE